jgi:hypothetical protein
LIGSSAPTGAGTVVSLSSKRDELRAELRRYQGPEFNVEEQHRVEREIAAIDRKLAATLPQQAGWQR